MPVLLDAFVASGEAADAGDAWLSDNTGDGLESSVCGDWEDDDVGTDTLLFLSLALDGCLLILLDSMNESCQFFSSAACESPYRTRQN